MILTLDVPTHTEESAEQRKKLLTAAIALYDARLITQGQAAEMAAMSRVEFFDALGRHGITPFQYDADEALADAFSLDGVEGSGGH